MRDGRDVERMKTATEASKLISVAVNNCRSSSFLLFAKGNLLHPLSMNIPAITWGDSVRFNGTRALSKTSWKPLSGITNANAIRVLIRKMHSANRNWEFCHRPRNARGFNYQLSLNLKMLIIASYLSFQEIIHRVFHSSISSFSWKSNWNHSNLMWNWMYSRWVFAFVFLFRELVLWRSFEWFPGLDFGAINRIDLSN